MPAVMSSIQKLLRPLKGEAGDYDGLLELIGEAPLVLMGEATHGTHEFYEARAEITKRLIAEKGFKAVAVEADWPDAYRVNRYVQHRSRTLSSPLSPAEHEARGRQDEKPEEALADFKRFPRWMWRNEEVAGFIQWLRTYNEKTSDERQRTGFYGLDLYSLYRSIEAVVAYLDKIDPEAAKRARLRYSCFEHFEKDPRSYGYDVEFGWSKSCEEEVLKQLQELNAHAAGYLRRDGFEAEDELFYAEQNARVARHAEEYYRAMFQQGSSSWNLRDRHMAKTLEALKKHMGRIDQPAKIVVWEHNSHVGDASATEMSERGEINVGQIMRSRFRTDAFLLGFTTYSGTVAAASEWDGPVEHKRVRPALSESYEDLFHKTGIPRFLLTFPARQEAAAELETPRLERAIGVIYLPGTERMSHYFYASLPRQFDAVIHFDTTRAVTPLEKAAEWERDIVPETYPFGL